VGGGGWVGVDGFVGVFCWWVGVWFGWVGGGGVGGVCLVVMSGPPTLK